MDRTKQQELIRAAYRALLDLSDSLRGDISAAVHANDDNERRVCEERAYAVCKAIEYVNMIDLCTWCEQVKRSQAIG